MPNGWHGDSQPHQREEAPKVEAWLAKLQVTPMPMEYWADSLSWVPSVFQRESGKERESD